MFFVAIGFIILFVAFLIALVSLIREQGQRVSEPDFEDLDDLTVSTESVPVVEQESSISPQENLQAQNILPSKIGEEPNLDETVPFPWEVQVDADYTNQTNLGKIQEAETVSSESALASEEKVIWRNVVE